MAGLIERNEDGLTPKQVAFLEAFFGEANFSALEAKRIAGYSNSTKIHDILKPLKQHIENAIQNDLAVGAAKSVAALIGVLDDPTRPGNREKIQAANSLLDRFGVTKEKASQVNVKVDVTPVVYLPEKKELELSKEDFVDITPEKD